MASWMSRAVVIAPSSAVRCFRDRASVFSAPLEQLLEVAVIAFEQHDRVGTARAAGQTSGDMPQQLPPRCRARPSRRGASSPAWCRRGPMFPVRMSPGSAWRQSAAFVVAARFGAPDAVVVLDRGLAVVLRAAGSDLVARRGADVRAGLLANENLRSRHVHQCVPCVQAAPHVEGGLQACWRDADLQG